MRSVLIQHVTKVQLTSVCLILLQDSKWDAKCEKIFKNTLQTILVLSRSRPETSMRLYLQGALCADSVKSESTTYEFLTQVHTV